VGMYTYVHRQGGTLVGMYTLWYTVGRHPGGYVHRITP